MTASLMISDTVGGREQRAAHWGASLAIVSFSAVLSLVLSGYAGGQENNIYHLPILARLYDEPQFSNDMFIQTLRFYASGFWQILAGRVHGQDVYAVLFVLQILSRMVLFAGVLAWAGLLGIESGAGQLVFTVLIALSSILRGYSLAGDGGLLIDYFTQSELANGTMLLALAWAVRGRIAAAFAMNGVTFFINAFIAVWIALPFAVILGVQCWQGQWRLRALLTQAGVGLAAFAVLALPVVHTILIDPFAKATPAFDYVTFLEEFFPYHFLIWAIPAREVWLLAIIFGCGMIAAVMLRVPGSWLPTTLLAAAAIWIIGVFLPFATHSRMLLNQHLLRASTMVHLLAALAVAALATRWLQSGTESDRRVWAPLLVLLSCTSQMMLPVIPVMLLARLWRPAVPMSWRPYVAPVLLLGVAASSGVRLYHNVAWARTVTDRRNDWQALGLWAQAHTPLQATFLIPTGASRGLPGLLPEADAQQAQLFEGSAVFAYFSHRPSWVSRPAGAAVMWAPAYYWTWRSRLIAVRALKTLPERLDYAAHHDIAYVVDGCIQQAGVAMAAHFGRLCVFAVPGRSVS
ncbi:hypothetical protein AA13595_0521 [Gluconacetobacter johannae DSM 13595]|uniref:Glycosyltransferase RgtA/B/C/D-like domain-containing protein n=1 Tax=Gluconacetobacter johannae TaxID=112140 RepID=A0A7W4JA64_9PROT|nr:hypothetical protein [Gluconacetobacter johannae]MBB2177502.1 hypothetical protein [Gluconacetobacter johannae]GBQ81109.1 hypothetical protein AA13595_0521 [Gluconacetobacter johannae DSM 13595]